MKECKYTPTHEVADSYNKRLIMHYNTYVDIGVTVLNRLEALTFMLTERESVTNLPATKRRTPIYAHINCKLKNEVLTKLIIYSYIRYILIE